MTEHLPECWAKHESDPEAWCICDELRACEKRLLEGRPDNGISEKQAIACYAIYRDGYAAALDAAREAVLALPEYSLRDTCASAIDALRQGN